MTRAQQQDLDDRERSEFLTRLDASEIRLTEWEEKFVGDFKKWSLPTNFWTGSDRRRTSCDQMRRRYEHQLPAMTGLSINAQVALAVAQADPGHCGYLKRNPDTGRQQPCSAPAVIKLRNGLELCADCNRIRESGLAQLRAAKERQLRS